jgi:hypothetical protein
MDFSLVMDFPFRVMLDWIILNKEWIFSGIGLSILSLGGAILFKKKEPKTQKAEKINTSGSVNIYQASDNAQINISTVTKYRATLLKVVDLSIAENGNYPNPILDLKLRNAGDEVAFVKAISFQTLRHWDIATDAYSKLKSVSATYDIEVSEATTSVACYNISHELKPQETDRIQVRLCTKYFGDPVGLSIFLLAGHVIYNEDDSKEDFCHLLVNIQPPALVQGSYFPGYSKGTVTYNKEVAKVIFQLPLAEYVVQEGILEVLQSWIDAPDEGEQSDPADS